MRVVFLLAAAVAAGCGYHVGGHADLLPKNAQTIAIPQFTNLTTHYKITDRLPNDLAREFISHTRFKIVSDPKSADLVLTGGVVNYTSNPTVFDPTTGRATEVDLHVYLRISLTERATGKVLFSRPIMDVRERYQISTNQTAFFEESDPAIDRASEQTARQVVSAILNNF